ncbi:MAG: hypothetical protein HYZ14_08785 [Bacteroidetes bacterium]|nr:hypothetical protein [Bacteroidota bacterium]
MSIHNATTKRSILKRIAEKAFPKLPSVLPAPERPAGTPVSSQWLSGEGAGSWFEIVVKDQAKSLSQINRYNPSGKMECSSMFRSDKIFIETISFEIVYPSHCNEVTVIQNGRKIHFKRCQNCGNRL